MTTANSRTRICAGPDKVEAVIPAARHRWTLFLLPLWIGGWLPMGWSVIAELALPGDAADFGPLLFQLAWVAIWLVGSFWIVGALIWSALGVERVCFARDHIVLVRQIAWFKLYLFYRPAEVKYLRVHRPLSFAVAGSAEAEQCKTRLRLPRPYRLLWSRHRRSGCVSSGATDPRAHSLVRNFLTTS